MSELNSGTLLQRGKYKIEKVLGQGGFGITYLAEQTNLNRKVCIKEFFMKEYGERTELPNADATVLTGVSAVTTGAAEIMGKYRDKFIKEAKTIAKLDHPGIVHIHDVFEENGTAYYVMDFVEGENLNNIVKREGPLSEDRALGYIRQIADALSYVHGRNIMHLDVKPANVLVRKSDDKAILIDFGTAKQYDSAGTQTSTTPVGLSIGYAPIELMKVGGVSTFSPETDVYSLGATLYYLVTGQNPPDASERMEMLLEGLSLVLPTTVSPIVEAAIDKTLQSRKNRPKSIAEFLELLPAVMETPASKKMGPAFCSACGEKLSPNVKFCPYCGTPVLPDIQNTTAIVGPGQSHSTDIEEGEEALPTFNPSLALYYNCNGKDDITLTMEVEMGNEKKLMAFVSFTHDDETPIMNYDSSIPFGGQVLLTKSKKSTIARGAISFDLSNTELAGRAYDETIIFNLNIILSKHINSQDNFDDDVFFTWRFSIKHISHIFRHDEWKDLTELPDA